MCYVLLYKSYAAQPSIHAETFQEYFVNYILKKTLVYVNCINSFSSPFSRQEVILLLFIQLHAVLFIMEQRSAEEDITFA